MKSTTRKLTLAASLAATALLAVSLGASSLFAKADATDSAAAGTPGRFYTAYNSLDDVKAAGQDFNKELADEGIVLLKNDGTLPVAAGAKVSVLGIAQDCMNETSGNIADSLAEAGYKINPTLWGGTNSLYDNDSASKNDYGNETALNNTQKESLKTYNDLAVVVIGRGTDGESSERSLNTGEAEDEKYLGTAQGWSHLAHQTSEDGKTSYKHELQLTSSEEDLISLAEENCRKVVVLYTSSNVFEMANLQNDAKINGILWIGRLGDGGISEVGRILNGSVSPSGKTVDEWTRDFTNDPTYANALTTTYESAYNGTNLYGLDYEEDIYLGYKFYETFWNEAKNGSNALVQKEGAAVNPYFTDTDADTWYSSNVVYPFGFGMSYTDFSMTLKSLKTDTGTVIADGSNTLSAEDLASNATDGEAKIKTLYAEVTVKNEGAVAGKEVVQAYVNAPYTTGGTEKAYLTLVGYAKTNTLQPQEEETVTIALNMQDMASYDAYDANGDSHTGYELDLGTYNLYFMESSAHTNFDKAACATTSFAITRSSEQDTAAVGLDLDDFSGNEIANRFSAEYASEDAAAPVAETEEGAEAGTTETEAKKNTNDFYGMLVSEDCGSMTRDTLLSRANFDGTMPTAPTKDQLKLSDSTVALMGKYEYICMDGAATDTYHPVDDSSMPWYKTDADIPSDSAKDDYWTQGAGVVDPDTGMYAITLNDMAGVPLYVNGEVNTSWVKFMNQLTWDEIGTILNDAYHYTMAIPTIGKVRTLDDNGPNYTYNETTWVGAPSVAANWNTELCERFGIMVGETALWQGMTGWYGPGANIHRSAFSGRSPEYYSQDALQGGYIAAAVSAGATSKGINVYIKHFAVYELSGITTYGCANISEQAMRENILKNFQIVMQEGGAHACMTSWNRIGAVYAGQNYALLQEVARDEWGWNGFFITDNYMNNGGITIDALIRAGAEIPDGALSGTDTRNLSGTWDASANKGQGGVVLESLDAGQTSATQWYCARMAAMRVLYNEANSAGNNNGITATQMSASVDLKQGTAVSESILPEQYTKSDSGYDIDCTVAGGSLPKGISIIHGIVTGTPYEGGVFNAELQLQVDGWITINYTLTLNVESIMGLDYDISSLTVGENPDTYVILDAKSTVYTDNLTYSISAGELPAGVTLDSATGYISGNATEAGTYTYTIAVTGQNSAAGIVVPDEYTWMLDFFIGSYHYTYDQAVAMMAGLGMAGYPSETYYMTYTTTVTGVSSDVPAAGGDDSNGSDQTPGGTDETPGSTGDTTSSANSGLAIAGLVIAIVAVVAAAAGIVLVLLRKKS